MIDTPSRPCPACGESKHRIKFIKGEYHIVRCSACSLVYLLNPPQETALYDEYYKDIKFDPSLYRADSPDSALGEYFAINQKRLKTIKTFKSGGSLLDIGCGKGLFLKTARDFGYQVQGLEVSNQAARFARQEFGFPVRVGDVAESEDSLYDIITLWHVLEHFIDPLEKLRQIRRLLKPGGFCFIEVPNLYSLKFMLSRRKWVGGNHPRYHRTFFTAQSLGAMLRAAGFTRVRRLLLFYHIPGRFRTYGFLKRGMNLLAMDAFLDYMVTKP
ncbi:class I SAM-dependent methyltransferase [candidate division KSB1 bacterium]|nr:class I SAM-dependent methyltransferase [candidate division KSB1 bacterium]